MTETTEKPQKTALQLERDEALDDLLSRWHHWMHGERAVRGHATRSLVAGDYITSRQYDDQNGALDDALETRIMQAMQYRVDQMEEPYRAAMYVEARALYSGVAVFRSPRLPADPKAARRIIDDGRALLTNKLVREGLMP